MLNIKSITTLRRATSCFLAFLLLGISAICAAQDLTNEEFPGASETINVLHQNLIEVMQNSQALGYKGRYQQLAPIISEKFDTPLIVKVILSRYWKKLDQQQQVDFIELFNQLSIATYAARFDEYNGEQFHEITKEKLKKGRLLVKTELHRVEEEPVKMDYLMHQKDGNWLIISVRANGVNDLSLKRAEYAVVIKEKGFDGLVEDIENKIKNMETEASG